jgi:short-subunit dehydrogenase
MAFRYQTVFITGASTGIGRALALELARRGCAVGMIARRGDLLDSLANEIGKSARVATAACDITDRAALIAALDKLRAELGTPDLLIANAGVGLTVEADHFSHDDIEQTINVNVIGALNTIYATLPHMLAAKRGHIVGVSSIASFRSFPGSSIYCASKSALSAALEGLRVELRPRGLHVTTICPGFIRTPMTDVNDFPMPFLMEVEPAAKKIIRAIECRRRVYAFPWQMNLLGRRFLGGIPDWLFDRLVSGRATVFRKNRPE